MTSTRIKICCIASIEEAAMAIRFGASALGLVSNMPSGPGVITEAEIEKIAAWTPPGVATFLLTCLRDGNEIVEQVRRCRTNTVQLCDSLDVNEYTVIRKEQPGLKIVQVIHVINEDSIAEAKAASEHGDALLLDSGNPKLAIKQLGGTGRVHNWEISRRLVQEISKPVFLAGGLTPLNVRNAIQTVKPYAVDVCSGVRSNGRLCEEKLKDFAEAVSKPAFT